MDRWSILASLGRWTSSAGVVIGALSAGCAGTGPAIVEHPRSVSMSAVAPERDPLAGALTFRPDAPSPDASAPDDASSSTACSSSLALRAPEPIVAPAHTILHIGHWSLALGSDETSASVTPAIALSAALSMSAGPPPHLVRATHGAVVVSVSEVAVEEGAWEESRR
jgi:hypothetical protein